MDSYGAVEDYIIDIRRDKTDPSLATSIRDELFSSLGGDNHGEKSLPEMLLWDEKGHQLFEQVNARPEYYVHQDEIALLTKHSEEIVKRLETGATIIELGSGDLTKVQILLSAFESAGKPVFYYALDLGLPNLLRTLSLLPAYTYVSAKGLHGTFDDGLHWLSTIRPAHLGDSRQKLLLSLGATLGNVSRAECAGFVSRFASVLQKTDMMLVSLDGTKDAAAVSNAYNDREGINQAFNANALDHANAILGAEVFKGGEWDTIGRWNAELGRHEWGYVFLGRHHHDATGETGAVGDDWEWEGMRVKKGERVLGILSWNYDAGECKELWGRSGVKCLEGFGVEGKEADMEGPKHCKLLRTFAFLLHGGCVSADLANVGR
ncbi:MAG: hypothetical protein LQ352_004489 [Teloschistes flavicans]|nr:MAG: hypothetical protein LQ352_004489 [Teloschistes flavicans]